MHARREERKATYPIQDGSGDARQGLVPDKWIAPIASPKHSGNNKSF